MVSSPTQRSTPAVADEAAVRGPVQQLMDGWNRGSGEGFAAPFAEDGDQVAFDGTRLSGRQHIAEFHQLLFDRFLRGTRLVGKVTDIRFLTPDVALAHGISGTVLPGETDVAPDRNSVQTLIAIKRDGEWRLARLHNSRADFMGRPEAVQEMIDQLRQLL